ncbi:hypothetical protein [Rhodocaloribacter sp.]
MRRSASSQRYLILVWLLAAGLTACGREDARPEASMTPPDSVRAVVERKIAALDALRSGPAQTIGDGFEVGDLRGIYSVFVPGSPAAP